MGTVHIIFGPQGAGKSTYARELADSVAGVRFSIDEWMWEMFSPDMPKPLSLDWVMESQFQAPTDDELAVCQVLETA